MKFLTLDGKEVNIAIIPSRNPVGKISRSKLQTIVGEKLMERYPQEQILEDFCIPRAKTLSLDFFIPRLKIAIEVSPIESGHTKHSSFFHGQITSGKFAKQKQRDTNKSLWCQLNNIQLVEITCEKDFEEWTMNPH